MKENIKEDIIALEQYLNAIDTFGTIDYKCINNLYEPVQHILSGHKRVLKENEELREKWHKDTHKLQNDLDLANAEKLKLQKENEELKMLIAHKNGYTQQLEQDLYENASNCVISKQKIKDKIEEVKNEADLYARGNIIAILLELLEEEK